MTIRAVIFDFGGVLIRSQDESGRRKWEAHLGLAEGELAAIVFGCDASVRATVGGLSSEEVWQHVAERFGLDSAQLRELQHDFWSGDVFDAELLQFLRDLRPRYKTAILSNAWPNARDLFVNHFGLGSAVDAMIISAEERLAKPDPRIYRVAVERLGVAFHEAVFVDDMEENVEAARQLGMKGVHFRNAPQALAEVRAHLDAQPLGV
jgi:putative hydrolase of the HAD superfamily